MTYFNVKDIVKIQKDIDNLDDSVKSQLSDGYHSSQELYNHRLMYNAALFNEWCENGKYGVHKSKRHSDGELCFDGNHFVVVAKLPDGLISNHSKLEHWDLFNIPEYEKSIFEFDGHTTKDVLERLKNICTK